MNPVFELNDLHVSLQSHHKEIELVRGVSFAVAPGECLGILGESGSGKSMSMKAAMGLLDHSFHVKGSAQFQGEELLGKSAEELRRLRGGKVGIILQNPMTCFDPLYRIGQQIAERFRRIITGQQRKSISAHWNCWKKCASETRRKCWKNIRISFPAVCSSAS